MTSEEAIPKQCFEAAPFVFAEEFSVLEGKRGT
jgi:hypothetical protein